MAGPQLPDGATRDELLALAQAAREKADQINCGSEVRLAGDTVARCFLATDHPGPHMIYADANHPGQTALQYITVQWETIPIK